MHEVRYAIVLVCGFAAATALSTAQNRPDLYRVKTTVRHWSNAERTWLTANAETYAMTVM